MSRIESGRVILHKEEFSLNTMLEQVNTKVMSQCRDKGINYECQIVNQVDNSYYGDDAKLKEVLLNILTNSISLTESSGSIILTIEKVAEYEDQTTLCFRIKDTGIGIEKEYIKKGAT